MAILAFDMDGVLMDSEPVYLKRSEQFLESLGYHPSRVFLNKMVGSNSRMDFQLLKENIPGFYDDIESYQTARRAYFAGQTIDYKELLNKEAYITFQKLKENNHSLCIASSSPRDAIEKIIAMLHVERFIDFIISGEEFQKSKPNPEIYQFVKSRYIGNDSQIFAVEDSTFGIQAAKAAGLKIICKIDNRFGFEQDGADYYINELSEIIDIVR